MGSFEFTWIIQENSIILTFSDLKYKDAGHRIAEITSRKNPNGSRKNHHLKIQIK